MNHSWRALLLVRSRPVPPRHPVAMWGCTHSSQAGEEPSRDHEVYGLIGEEGFRRLAASFYSRVLLDDVLFPMYRESQILRGETDLSQSESRLCDYLVGRFGGPQRYVEQHGHPRLRWRHNPFPISQAARDRWLALMEASMQETLGPDATALPQRELRRFFDSMSQFLINRDSS